MADAYTAADPSDTANPVEDDTVDNTPPGLQTLMRVLVPIGVLAVMVWSVTRAHSCGGSWPAAAVRGLVASGLSFGAAASVAYVLVTWAFAATFSGHNMFYGLMFLAPASFFGIAVGGVALLTRCK